jgi:hypothetical protein
MDLQYQTFPLPAGTKAIRFTVQKMVDLIRAGIKSPLVRQKAVQVLKAAGAPSYNHRAEVAALFSFVRRNFHYVKDPTLVELIHTPEKLLEVRSGDCDDFTVIIASLLGAVGYETRVAIAGPGPGIWSHTFPEVWLDGRWVALDATVTDKAGIERAKKSGHYKTFALQGGSMLSGFGAAAVEVKPTVAIDGNKLFQRLVQGVVDYLHAELDAGTMKPAEISRYLMAVHQEPTMTPLMKTAVVKAVELVGLYRFGWSSERMLELSRLAGPGDLGGFLGGVFRIVKKVVGTVVKVAKAGLGIPENQPVSVKVELPPGTNPQPVNLGNNITAQVDASKAIQAQAWGGVGDFFSKYGLWIGLGLAAVFVVPKLLGSFSGGGRRR